WWRGVVGEDEFDQRVATVDRLAGHADDPERAEKPPALSLAEGGPGDLVRHALLDLVHLEQVRPASLAGREPRRDPDLVARLGEPRCHGRVGAAVEQVER